MRMLNARASRSLPLVLLVIPAVVVVLYVVLSGLHWAVLSASAGAFRDDGACSLFRLGYLSFTSSVGGQRLSGPTPTGKQNLRASEQCCAR
jgi:hypothetical protein